MQQPAREFSGGLAQDIDEDINPSKENPNFETLSNSNLISQHFLNQRVLMAEIYGQHHPQHKMQPQSHLMVKAATAATAGSSLLILTVASPLLVIFSPVLVSMAITMFLVAVGFLASGGFGVAVISVLTWIYRYVTGTKPPGAEQLDTARDKVTGKAREMKDKAEQYTTGSQTS